MVVNITCKDISVIHVTAHKCSGGLKKLDARSGFNCQRIVGFFNVSVQSLTGGAPFLNDDSEKPPHLVAFYDTLRIRRTHFRPNPRVLTGGHLYAVTYINEISLNATLSSQSTQPDCKHTIKRDTR